MDRNQIIAYSYFFNGEYDKILDAIKVNREVEEVHIDNCITIFDNIYPKKLLALKYPPFVLYYKGNISLLNEDAISIVGSRMACDYALKATEHLAKHYKDKVIVSGMAKGVDGCAHKYAKKTIGILGCGIDYIYPYCHLKLYEEVIEKGLLISEYPGKVKPLAYHFPFRNRLIAALGNPMYIMESKINSGTMTSINEALELGNDIKVLPYDIFNKKGINNNRLISEGAMCIENDEIAFCE